MARQLAVGRIDDIIGQLERLHKDAQRIFDAHIDFLLCRYPRTSFGVMKAHEICTPAGSTLDYIAALRIVQAKITAG